jgi:subtilisin family serine protease
MRLRIGSLVLLVLALTVGAQFPATQIGVEVSQGLADRVANGGAAPVIVGVQIAFTPEGDLGGPEEVTRQRESIQRALDVVTDRVVAAGMTIGRRFSYIPYFTTSVDASQLAALAGTPGVASIQEDIPERIVLTDTVPLTGAAAAHAAGFNGTGWSVAILDTGVEKTHPFIGASRVVSEACFSNLNGVGSTLSPPSSSVCPGGVNQSVATGSGVNCSAAIDGCDHGTHVAGIAAGAAGISGAPTSGMAPGANVIAVQVFSRFDNTSVCGGAAFTPCVLTYTGDQIAALERIFELAGPGNAGRIASVNMSLGGGRNFGFCDSAQASRKAAIDNLLARGVATVIATGNDGFTDSIGAPACISTAISVGSTTKTDAVSNFSNRRAGLVDLMAPGSSIRSSVPGGLYANFNGTSMATPHVAGAWAALKQFKPTAAVGDVLTALQNTGVAINDTLSDQEGPQAVYQRISVNAARLALGTVTPGPPGPPGTPTIGGSGNNVTISWTTPTTGDPPTSYTVLGRLTCGGAVVGQLPLGVVNTVTIPVPNGTYCVSVRAANGSGAGPESAGTTFNVPVVGPPPGAPTALSVSVVGTTANFTWGPPASGGPVAAYVMLAALSAGGTPIAQLSIPPQFNAAQISGVPPGTYFVRMVATNAGGTSPPSNEVTVSVAGPQPPGAPTLNPASVSPSRVVTLSWTPGAGGTPSSYTIVARQSPAGPVIASVNVGLTNPISVGAPPGTYFVQVVASNALGNSPPSNQITVVVP